MAQITPSASIAQQAMNALNKPQTQPGANTAAGGNPAATARAGMPVTDTPELYTRLFRLQQTLSAAQTAQATVRLTEPRIDQLASQLGHLRDVVLRMQSIPEGASARMQLRAQVQTMVAQLIGQLVQPDGKSGARTPTNASLQGGLERLVGALEQLFPRSAGQPQQGTGSRGTQALQPPTPAMTEHLARIGSGLQQVSQLLAQQPSISNALAARVLTILDQAMGDTRAIQAQLLMVVGRAGQMLAAASAPNSPPNMAALGQVNLALPSPLAQSLSMSRLVAAHAAVTQFAELARRQSAADKEKSARKAKKNRDESDMDPLFENFFTFFSSSL